MSRVNESMNESKNELENNPDASAQTANAAFNETIQTAISAVDNLNNDLLAEATALKNSLENATSSAIATVRGEAFTALPVDLYIPPDAMEVILEIFEGPLDLLLYLIRKHNLDILDIPVAEITRQYTEYVDLMTQFRLELAADYLEMAALLAEIKSRMLLPRPPELEGEEQDPRAELVRRLQEYERIKVAAEQLEQMPRLGRDFFTVSATPPKFDLDKPQPYVDLREILLAFKDVLKRIDHKAMHEVQREGLSVRERMSRILTNLAGDKFIDFVDFFDLSEGRLGVVVTFLALLELLREMMIELVQTEAYGPIYVRAPGC
jgi:segregation and condensation protein A